MRCDPIGIVGVSCLYPGVQTLEEFGASLRAPRVDPVGRPRQRRILLGQQAYDRPLLARPALEQHSTLDTRSAAECRYIDECRLDPAHVRLPPAQISACSTTQLLMLQVAGTCVASASRALAHIDRARMDVYVATSLGFDRTYQNALRVEGLRAAATLSRQHWLQRQLRQEFEQALCEQYGASSHDRIGEMASSIPARIAVQHGCRGLCLALDMADGSSMLALQHALQALSSGACEAALVVAGQTFDGVVLPLGLSAKGVASGGGAGAPLAAGLALGEGFTAVLLKRLSDCERDGDTVLASIEQLSLVQGPDASSLAYRPLVAERTRAIGECCEQAGIAATELSYIECNALGVEGDSSGELAALRQVLGVANEHGVALGSVRRALAHTYANSGLASLGKLVLAMSTGIVPDTTLDIQRAVVPGNAREPGADLALDAGAVGMVLNATLTATVSALLVRRVAGAGQLGASHGTAPRAASRAAGEQRPLRRRGPVAHGQAPNDPIAIVGMGARFSDCGATEEYCRRVMAGHSMLRPVPESILPRAEFFDPARMDPCRSYAEIGCPVAEPDLAELQLIPKRVHYLDGAHRLALATAADALRFVQRGEPQRTAVFFGSNSCLGSERALNSSARCAELLQLVQAQPTFQQLALAEQRELAATFRALAERLAPALSPFSLDGVLASSIGSIVSLAFKLQAVPISVEAACASSLAALNSAVNQLRSGEFDLVLAGGVELPVNLRDLLLCCGLRLLSRSTMAPFDVRADGFSPGAGAAVFALRRLKDAVRLGEPVLALIRAVGGSSDARSMIAPSVDGQALAIRRAFANTDFTPDTVDYVEAHGTGTEVGDVVELEALSRVYGAEPRVHPLFVSSVKSLIGHTFAAAGAAGLVRAVTALRQATIPPTAQLQTPNPALNLAGIPVVLPTQPVPWTEHTYPRRAAVSSFGTGGINYHLLVEEWRSL